ncbi:MAG: hypothetical protein QOG03_1140 [Actinomycetota bacterium]|jgi:AcrR family transcriptional regulator|nr:hypothetical protein [Actinomycetota bacterium]
MRLATILRRATRVFATKGYRRTQMADVAKACGVSAGNLYNYVESKEALFLACLLATSPAGEERPDASDLPIPTPPAGAIGDAARRGALAIRRGSLLTAALKVDEPDDAAAELAGIIGDFFDRTAASRHFQSLVEGSAQDLPELYDAFFTKTRGPGLRKLTEYLERRIASGHLRAVPDAATTARLINESQAWFARHRHGDQDTSDVDDSLARATVVDVLVAGLLPR